jgi:hypothetical protein
LFQRRQAGGFETGNLKPETVVQGVQFILRLAVRGGNGNPEELFPVSGFETRNTKLETDVRPDADQTRRLIG